MASTQTNGSTLQKPLRLWPGVVAAVLLLGRAFEAIARAHGHRETCGRRASPGARRCAAGVNAG